MIGVLSAGGLLPGGVSATTALGLSSVWRCVQILADGVSQLPWAERRGNLDLPLSPLVRRPQGSRTRREWTSLVTATMALFNVAYLLKLGEDSEGVPGSLIPIPPAAIAPLSPMDQFGLVDPAEYWVAGRKVPASELVILRRLPFPGLTDDVANLIGIARTMFASAIAADNYASRYWQAGGSPVTVLTSDQPLTQQQADDLGQRWGDRRAMGPDFPAVLGLGAHAEDFGADPTAASAVEARREMVADVARYFGVPTRLVNAPTGDSETYATTGDTNLDLLRFGVQGYVDAICDAVSDQLPGQRHVEMDTTVLTRGSHLARAQAWQLATGGKAWMTPADVREIEDLAPLEGPALAELNPPAPAPVLPPNRQEPAPQRPANG